jgi:hypothetical protein
MTDKPVHTKKPLTRPSAVQIEDAIRKSAGNVTAAARGLGVGRTALHARIAKSPDLQRVLQEEREALVDMAECATGRGARPQHDGDYLDAQGVARGQAARVERTP